MTNCAIQWQTLRELILGAGIQCKCVKACRHWISEPCLHGQLDIHLLLSHWKDSYSNLSGLCAWIMMPSCLNTVFQTLWAVSFWTGQSGTDPFCPIRESFLSSGFSSSTVLGVFLPVYSLQPQWGHYNNIQSFRTYSINKLGCGSGGNKLSQLWSL